MDSKTKKKSIAKNYIYNLTFQILKIILPIITTPYISRTLGAENIGIYGYTLSISAYFILFGSLGVAMYGQREIAYNQENKKEYSKIFWEVVIFRIITMIISMICFGIVFASHGQYAIYYRILLLEMLGNCLDISWFFQGQEDFKRTVLRNLAVKLISVISIFVFIKTSNDLMKYFWIYVLSILIGNVSLWFYLPKYLDRVKFKELNIFRHFRPTVSLFVPQIAVDIYTVLDKTMIGTIISDKSEVGYYEQSQKIVKVLLAVITSLGTVMMPRIANTFARGEKEKVTDYMKKSFNLVFLLAFPLILGIIVATKNFVPLFFGEGYNRVIIIMQVISPIILFIGLSSIVGTQYLLPTKRQKEYTVSVICGALVNFLMNSILIWKFGAMGAAIGTVIAEFTVTAVQIYFVRKDFNLLKIAKISINYILSSFIMFGCCYLINFVNVGDLVNIILKVLVGMIVYGLALLILKDEFINQMICKFMNKILSRRNKENEV